MNEIDEQQIAQCLRAIAAGPPPVRISPSALVRRAHRRRHAAIAIGAAAAVATAVGLSLTLPGEDPHPSTGIAGPPAVPTHAPSAVTTPPSAAITAGCPPRWSPPAGQGAAIDYMDTVKFAGRDYMARPDEHVAAADVREVVGQVRCRISDYPVDPEYRLHDGDATRLPAGTDLHAVAGASPDQVLAVIYDGRILIYRALATGG